MPPGGWSADYARFLLKEEGGGEARWHAAARPTCIEAAEYADLEIPGPLAERYARSGPRAAVLPEQAAAPIPSVSGSGETPGAAVTGGT